MALSSYLCNCQHVILCNGMSKYNVCTITTRAWSLCVVIHGLEGSHLTTHTRIRTSSYQLLSYTTLWNRFGEIVWLFYDNEVVTNQLIGLLSLYMPACEGQKSRRHLSTATMFHIFIQEGTRSGVIYVIAWL